MIINNCNIPIISHCCIVSILTMMHAHSNKYEKTTNHPHNIHKQIRKKYINHHTNLLKGLLPTAAGIDTVESMLKSPLKCEEICFSGAFCAAAPPSLADPLFHLNEPMFAVNENENRLFDSLAGVSTALSFGLLLALALALAEAVGVM